MMYSLWELIVLLLPAGIANMVPPLFAGIKPEWNYPVDCGLSFRGKRLLGDHKTFKGFITAIIAGELSFLLLKASGLVEMGNLPWFFGGLLGFLALFADSLKSFFKRQAGVTPGKSWFPWDQLDWVIGAIAGGSLYIRFEIWQAAVLLLIGLLAHLLTKVIGYAIKVNDIPI